MFSRIINIDDLRRQARRRLPRVIFDYIDGGAEAEFTLRENCRAFEDLVFRPSQGAPVAECDLRTQVLGTGLSFPAILAPLGCSRLMHPGGELAAARAAAAAGTVYILSTISSYKLEDVKAVSTGQVWYQLYLVGGRDVALAAIERAKRAGFSALVVTVDTPAAGMRERDVRNGMKELLGDSVVSKIPFLPQFLIRPGWLTRFLLDGGVRNLENIIIPGQGPMPLSDVSDTLARAAVVWEDLQWIREVWSGPIVIKGVLTAEDAKRAIDSGAAAVVVSNHGGRQLDSVCASIRALPEVVAAVNGRAEVLMDGGIRRGSDIVKAVCLGATAVLCGRAYAYGLAAAGQSGVSCALEILRVGVERTVRLLGCPSVALLNASYLNMPHDWSRLPGVAS